MADKNTEATLARVRQYDPLIEAAAKKWGVDANELRAVMATESKGRPELTSNMGAQGLMQVMPMHTRGAKNPFDPAYNIDKGAEVLSDSYKTMRAAGIPQEKLQQAAWAGYNRTPRNVAKDVLAGKDPNFGTDSNAYPKTVGSYLSHITSQSYTSPHAEAAKTTASDKSDDGTREVDVLPSGEVPFEDYSGELTTVPQEKAGEAFYTKHLKPVSADEYTARKSEEVLRQKYGSGALEAAKAAGEGGLNGLFGDAGDAILAATGVESKEAIKAHERYFGGLRKGAAGATLVGSLLTGEGELGAAAKAGELGKAGEAVNAARGAGAEAEAAGKVARSLEPKGQMDLPLGKIDEGHPAFRGATKPRAEQMELPLGDKPPEPSKQLSFDDVQFKNQGELPLDVQEGGKPPQQLPLSDTNPTPEWKAPRKDGKFSNEWDLGRKAKNARPPTEQLGFDFQPTQSESDAAANALGPKPEGQLSFDLPEGKVPVEPPYTQQELPLAERKVPTAPDKISRPEQPPGSFQRGGDFKADYAKTVKQYGKDVADAIVEKSEQDKAAFGVMPEDQAKTGAGGANLYNPEGKLGGSGVEFAPPGSDMAGQIPAPVNEHPAFKNIAVERPAGDKYMASEAAQEYGAPKMGARPPPPPAEEIDPSQIISEEPAPVAPQAAAPTSPLGKVEHFAPPMQPPATPQEVQGLLHQAADFATTPNRAVFGVGARFGRAVEQASGSKALGMFADGALQSVPYTVGHNLSEAELNDEKITPERLFAGGLGNALLSGTVGGAFGLAAEGLHQLNFKFGRMGPVVAPAERVGNIAKSFNDVLEGSKKFSKAVYDDGLKYARTGELLGDSTTAVKTGGSPQWQQLNKDTDDLVDGLVSGRKSQLARAVDSAHTDYLAQRAAAQTDAQLFEAGDRFKRKVGDAYNSLRNSDKEIAPQVNDLMHNWRRGLEDTATFGKAAELQAKLNEAWKNLIRKNSKKSPIFASFMRKGMLSGEGEMVFDESKIANYIKDAAKGTTEHQTATKLREQIMQEWLGAHRDYADVLRKEIYAPLQREQEIAAFHGAIGGDDSKIADSLSQMRDMSEGQKKTFMQKLLGGRAARFGAAGAMMVAGVPHAFMVAWTTSMALEHIMGLGLGKAGFAEALVQHGARFDGVIDAELERAFTGKASAFGGSSVGVFKQLNLTPHAVSENDRHARIAEVAANLAKTVTDPSMPAKIAAGTKMLSIAHPDLAATVQAQAFNTLNYLHEQAPKDPLPPDPFNQVPFRPGHAESARFEDVAEVAMNPLTIVRDFGNGTLSTAQVTTAQTIYPQIVDRIRQKAAAQVGEHAGKMTYQQKLAFGKLMGTPVDWASQPDAVQVLQKTFSLPAMGQGNPSAGGNANKPKGPTSAKQATQMSNQIATQLQSSVAMS